MSKVIYDQTGYVGSSMSVRAVFAYETGEKPKSKWTKKMMLAELEAWCFENDRLFQEKMLAKMKKEEIFCQLFAWKSWHHTSKFANATDFYGIDEYACEDFFPKLPEAAVVARDNARKAARAVAEAKKVLLDAEIKEAEADRVWRESVYEITTGMPARGLAAMESLGLISEGKPTRRGKRRLVATHPKNGTEVTFLPENAPWWVKNFSALDF